MTRPRATTSPSDALGATIADLKARLARVENVAHQHKVLGSGLGLQEVLYFDTVGTATFTKATYPWLRAIRVTCAGSGGGGGGSGTNNVGASGGGGANTAISFITNIAGLASSVTVTVAGGGAGGAAGNNNGGNGSASSFGSLVSAAGGAGGFADGGTTGTKVGTTTGQIILRGQDSEGGGPDVPSTAGGAAHLCGGTRGIRAGAQGGGLSNPDVGGGGGGGGRRTTTNQSGGAGAQGIVIVELFG
jgi:hypothetical protein